MAAINFDIQRTFFDLPTDENSNIDQAEFLANFSREGRLTWHQLLESERILIVSEAGVGKSYECQRQQRQLWDEGESAFFVELAVLATDSLESQFSVEEKDRFDSWRSAQTEHATFFLDSIDELKLTQRSFELTLKRFATALSGHLDRARIVLTTRPIAIDRELVRKWLPVQSPMEVFVPETYFANVAMQIGVKSDKVNTSNAPLWRFVALSPLNEQQMHVLATAEGVIDPVPLLNAIESQHAQDFAKRPLDFIELCGDWKVHNRIRSHQEQVNHNVEVKLRARNDRSERLSLTSGRAREGAARLALAALLTRRFTIWHGQDNDRGRGDSALDPGKILTDWSSEEIRTLLERPLFGFATYGRVRFHNRSVIEFLAAERLLGLLRKGMSIRTLSRLLFAATPVGVSIVKPTMQPVAAWLASHDPIIRAGILLRDASILLRYADPSSLDLAMRTEALEKYVSTYGKGGWRGQSVPTLQVHRLASPELAPVIQHLWSQQIENPEVRETLLELIGAGKLTQCADIPYSVAIDTKIDFRSRLEGLLALRDIDDPRLPSLIDQLSKTSVAWPAELASASITHLFPGHMSVTQLLATLATLKPKPKEIGGITTLLPLGITRAGIGSDQLAMLRTGLMSLIEPTCKWHEQHYHIRTQRLDLVPALIAACRMQLAAHIADQSLFDSIVLALHLADHDTRGDEDAKELKDMFVDAHPSEREATFWALDRLMQQHHSDKDREPWHRLFHFLHHPPFEIDFVRDADWVRAALADTTHLYDDRNLLLELGMQFSQGSSDRLGQLKALVPLVADSAALAERISRAIMAIESPAPEPTWLRDDRVRKEKYQRKQAKDLASWKLLWRELSANPNSAFAPDRIDNTTWNLWRVMCKEPSDRDAIGWNRGFIERCFNRETANHLREALRRAWRNDRPTLKSERSKEERNSYFIKWRMGLAGIYAESEDSSWAVSLSALEVDLATRFALVEMNGLPAWLDSLVQTQPAIVETIIGNELMDELTDESDRHSFLLQNIESSSPLVVQLFLNRIRTWFESAQSVAGGPMLPLDKLERAARILLEHGTAEDTERLKTAGLTVLHTTASQSQVLFWLPILLNLDPATAVDFMERSATSISPTRNSEVTEWIAEVFGHRGRRNKIDLAALESDPRLLLRLARLVYQHIRFEDDLEHSGVYSPETRDHAQRARSEISNALLNCKGAEAWAVKLEFSKDPLVSHFKDRALAIAEEKLAEEWDASLFDEAGITRLESEYEFAPLTRMDMADLLEDRLADLDDLLLQDGSPRELWQLTSQEKLLRREVARSIQQMAKTAYMVNQEAVTGEEKETDIRLRSSASTQEGVIELKVAENGYSVNDLREALETQLLHKYLAPEHRRVGCLLISISSDRYWLHPDDKHKMNIIELVEFLNAQARELVNSMNGDVFLFVKALDLRPRL